MITYPTNKLQKVLLSGACEQRNLPTGYQQVEYLESTGTQYIDTGIVLPSTFHIKTKIRFLSFASEYGFVCGARNQASVVGRLGFTLIRSTSKLGFDVDETITNRAITPELSINTWYTVEFIVDSTGSKFLLDGTLISAIDKKPSVVNYSLYILSTNTDNSPTNNIGADLRDFQISGLANYIPCRRKSDSVLGMYDTVTNTFLTNQGTGNFIAGPDVVVYAGDNNFKGHTDKVDGQLVNNNTYNWVRDTDNNLVFPDGMKSAGSVYDEIVYENGVLKAIKRIGSVDLGTLSWTYDNINKRFNCHNVDNIKVYVQPRTGPVICDNYTEKINNEQYDENWDKVVYQSNADIYIHDHSYSNAAALKASLAGVMLYYELATPIEYTLSNVKGVVPTPDMPMNIWCNNGVLKLSPNLFDYRYFYDNYQEYGTSDVGRCPIKLKPNTTYTISTNRNLSGDVVSVMFVVSGSAINWTPNTVNNGVKSTSPRIVTTDSEGYLCFGIYIRGDREVPESEFINGTTWVQIEQGSTATPYMPYGQIYTEGTQEVVTDNLGNTATAEMLLGVGDYKDTQEVLSGKVTRNIGIKVLDGTEDWTYSSEYGRFQCIIQPDSIIQPDGNRTIPAYCTHFKMLSNSEPISDITSGQGYLVRAVVPSGTNTYLLLHSSLTTIATFKQQLADQYNAGTPVIIVYPLAEPTTEQVTPQPLSGSSAIVTAGSIDNLPIESSTIAELKKRYIGDKEVKRVYIGENLVWKNN